MTEKTTGALALADALIALDEKVFELDDAYGEYSDQQFYRSRGIPTLARALKDAVWHLQNLHCLLDFDEPFSDEKPIVFEDPSEINAAFANARAFLAKHKEPGQ